MYKLYKVKGVGIPHFLKDIKQYKLNLMALFVLTLVSLTAFAQNNLSGTVTDSKGIGLPGVNVIVKGTKNGTVTDNQGKYVLKVSSGSPILVFTYLGFKAKEMPVGAKKTVDITLEEDATGLDEVLVVGYGTQKKSTATGAISQITSEDIMKSPTPNPTNALIGRLPGLLAVQTSGQPGADGAALKIRGVATYGVNNSAIVVVDGIERPSFSDVDQNEIETITVLKDAASTAIYGIRGANGVIVITTKVGKIGAPKVSYSGNIAQQSYTGLAVGLGAYDSAILLNQSYANDGKPLFFTDADIEKFKDGSDPLGHPDVKWFDYLTRKYYSQTQHNININGGTKVAKYFVSAGYAFQDGIFKKFDSPYGINTVPNYNRYNFRTNLDFTLNKDLTVGVKLGGRFSDRYQPAGLLSSSAFSYDTIEGMISRILQVPAYAYPVTLPDGRITANPNIGTNIWNPLAVLTRFGTRNDYVNTVESTFDLNYKLGFITKGLSFRTVFGYDSYYNNTERRNANWAAWVYNASTGTATLSTDTRNRDEPLGAVQDGGVTGGSTNMNIQSGFNYDQSYGKHTFGALALGTRQLVRTTGATAFTAPPKASQGIAGRVTYNYDARYFAEFNGSYNGSENFPPGLRYGFFPAISGAWALTSEPFWKKNDILNNFRIKGSYGVVGNDKISDLRFLYLTSYSNNTAVPFGDPLAITNFPTLFIGDSALGNEIVTWEKGTKRNIGFESMWFNNTLKVNVDIFDETRKDILTNSLSGSSLFGHSYPKFNKGVVYNKGYEVEMDLQKHIGAVTVGLNTQLSYAKNKILENDEPDGMPKANVRKGTSVGQYFGYVTDGFYQSAADIAASPKQQGYTPIPGDLKFKDLDGDGVITSLDQQAIGYTNNPEYIFSFSPRVNYKGFGFSVLIQGVAHVSSSVILTEQNNGQQMYPFMLEAWTPANAATATWPALHARGTASLNYALNDFTLQNSAYTKIRNVEFSYTFPKKWSETLKVGNVRLFLQGQNLYTWTKYRMYVDPENVNTVNTAFPLQALYPTSKVYNFGINVTF